ncbi:MAG: cytochrome c3 family protein [Carboxydocellales bacterium]
MLDKLNKKSCLLLLAGLGLLLFVLSTPGAEAKFSNAATAQCTACHTSSTLTVGLFSDSGATVALDNPINVNSGSTLIFYTKVSGMPIGQYIGAGIYYPAGLNPMGGALNKQDANTWTTYTLSGQRLANNAEFNWNSKNINMTKNAADASLDVLDSDNNGYEIFPGTLNVPAAAPPGNQDFTIYGAGTAGKVGSVNLTVNVVDTTVPAQITDLSAKFISPNIHLTWTTPTPPDNSASLDNFKIYRYTDPITTTNLASATLVQTIAGTAANTVNKWNDPNSADLITTTIYYYAVMSVDANSNTSVISTGPKVSVIKSSSAVPTASMFTPSEGSSKAGTIALSARATDDVEVTSVSFEVSTDTAFTAPTTVSGAALSSGKTTDGFWSVNWDSAGINGTRYLRAKALDGTNTGISGYYTVTVDNTAPTPVSMVAPDNQSTVQNIITLQASAQDNLGVDSVVFQAAAVSDFSSGVSTYAGAALTAGTATNGTWSRAFSTNILTNGTQYLRAVIYDKANNSAITSAFQYTVNNAADTVPHGNYSVTTESCAICHNTHAAQSKYLINAQRIDTVCLNCHDGTSAQKVNSFPSTYVHISDTKDVHCNNCHNPHKSKSTTPVYLLKDTYDSGTKTGDPTEYNLCFNCHKDPYNNTSGYVQATADIYQYYSKLSNSGAGTKGQDKGHFIQYDRYTFPDGTAVPVGFQLRCTDCHDQHGSSNKYLLRTKLGTNPNAITINSSGILTVTEERNFCKGCHNGTTKLYNPADSLPIIWEDLRNSAHTDATKRCSSCHGGSGTVAQQITRVAHTPGAGESSGGQECLACHTTLQDSMSISITNTFHHVVDYVTFQADYSLTKSCLQCHVDHDKFRPGIAAGNKRGANLRTKYEAVNSATATNTDFINDAVGGLCLSCHTVSKTKAYDGTKSTQAISTPAVFNASKHNYVVYSTFSDTVSTDNTTKFTANCTKCHNDYSANSISYDYQTSSNPFIFGVHSSSIRSILGKLGVVSPTQPLEEDLCYRCHSGTTAKDYYQGVDSAQGSAMTAKSQAIQTAFGRAYKHPITSARGIHQAVEGASAGWAKDGGNRHVECQDCHNTHAAKIGTSRDGTTYGANAVRDGKTNVDDTLPGSLNGIWGVDVTSTYTTRGTVNSGDKTTYNRTDTLTRQWQLCLKCHSDYAWDNGDTSTGTIINGGTGAKADVPNTSFPLNTTVTNTGTGEQPDIGQQFNPGNYAFHPLFEVGLNQPATNANANWASSAGRRAASPTYKGGDGSATYPYNTAIEPAGLDNTFVDGWGTKSLLTCTDCHASTDDTPDGPHGSTQKWLLRKAESRTVTTTGAGTLTLNSGLTETREINNFCVNCHRADVYGKGTGSDTPAYENLSRFKHAFRKATLANPAGNCMGSANYVLGGSGTTTTISPSCLGCHGGREPGGIHGSASTSPQGKRFTNGANWTAHTLGTTSPSCTVPSSADNVAACTKGHNGTSSANSLYYSY